jgi:two-component system, OmpR family, response regulator BaeR
MSVQSNLVLIAEDDAQSARVLAQMLREDGYEVELVGRGRDAMKRLAHEPRPAVAILDYRLPDVDGLTVAREARRNDMALIILIVTSYVELVADAIKREPSLHLLEKPLSYAELVKRLPSVERVAS